MRRINVRIVLYVILERLYLVIKHMCRNNKWGLRRKSKGDNKICVYKDLFIVKIDLPQSQSKNLDQLSTKFYFI